MGRVLLFAVLSVLVVGGMLKYLAERRPEGMSQEQLIQLVQSLQKQLQNHEGRIAQLEKRTDTLASLPRRPLMLPSEIFSPTSTTGSTVPEPEVFDDAECEVTKIISEGKLAATLTWDPAKGGEFIGDLPVGTEVEIISKELYRWNDYPHEHGLYIRVSSAPMNPSIEEHVGFIELIRIDHKRCQIGAELDR